MFYDILDKKRLEIIHHFINFKDKFYLAGGTSLALQIGHRDSFDFDFFSDEQFDTEKLFQKVKDIFKDHDIKKIYEEKNTLTVALDNSIKISFFYYKYPLIDKLIDEPFLKLASKEDIGCMKLTATTGRSSNKDYVDLYYILQTIRLEELLKKAEKKFKDIDINLILKSLVFTGDIENEPIMFKHSRRIGMDKIGDFLKKEVKKAELERIKWA